jgi:phosphoenolpyruvate phosphomutase
VGAIILAAGASPELGELTKDRPKAMLDVKGKPILAHQVDALNAAGIKDISVVVGWKKEAVNLPNLKTYAADASEGEVASLMEAAAELDRRALVLYGDILFDQEMVERLLHTEGDVVLVVDRSNLAGRSNRDLVQTLNGEVGSGQRFLKGTRTDTLGRIGQDIEGANGEWIGMMMVSRKGAEALRGLHAELAAAGDAPVHEAGSLATAALTDLIQALVEKGLTVNTIDTYKGWMEIDSFEDYQRAWAQMR